MSLLRWPGAATLCREDPWSFAETLFGGPVARIQTMKVKTVPGFRAYTSSSVEANMHTDSGGLWVPAHAQVMISVRAAESGGESLLLDSWPLLRRLEKEDPGLFAHCFDTVLPMGYRQPWWGPPVCLRDGNLIVTHPPEPAEHPLAERLHGLVGGERPTSLCCQPGDVLVFSNHRVLHGRRAFTDTAREFLKLHAWLPRPFAAPVEWVARAAAAADSLAQRLADQPGHVRHYFGLRPAVTPRVHEQLGTVLRVVAAGCNVEALRHIAEHSGCDVADLLQWQDTVLLAGLRALGSQPTGAELEEAVGRVFDTVIERRPAEADAIGRS
jgi:hypothetical protein